MSNNKKYIGAIDQGTTSTRFVIFDHGGQIIALEQVEHTQIYPEPGWVEHNPLEIKDNTFKVISAALTKAGISASQLCAIGITNQRETTVVWNPKTGDPYYNAIVWQDTRTAAICKELAINDDINCYRDKTGLPLATYFSGPKLKWILDNVNGMRKACTRNEVAFGTIDSYLTWWLTGGPEGGVHITDVSNASRTMLMNLETLQWDEQLLKVMGIPRSILPEIKSSSEIYGFTKEESVLRCAVPIAGILGDQQAALFGQTCFSSGEAKNTYGTGGFLLLNTGEDIVHSRFGLITTVAYKLGDKPACYALEGSIAIAGSLVQWVRDNLGLIKESAEIETLAASVEDNGGVYFVPAFSGLFAPYWRSDARGVVTGLTHYSNKGHIARAVLEATAFQTTDILKSMEKDTGITFKSLKVDGGMVVNQLLMQFQSDLLGILVIRPRITETTVLGAAYAAGLAVQFWENTDDLKKHWLTGNVWEPAMDEALREKLLHGWNKAIEKSYV